MLVEQTILAEQAVVAETRVAAVRSMSTVLQAKQEVFVAQLERFAPLQWKFECQEAGFWPS